MKTTGITCVKNESDIIEAFVRHNLHYLDHLLVLNHGSTDATGRILQALVREGLSLTLIEDDSLGKFQGEKMTRLMRRAAEEGADWILPLDADEFIKCPGDRLPLPPPGKSGLYWKVGFTTYCVDASDDPQITNPVQRITHRLAREPIADRSLDDRRYLLKAFIPKNTALLEGLFLVQGNHHLLLANSDPEHTLWEEFTLAHYSIRSVGQYASKISISHLQHLYKSSPHASTDGFYLPFLENMKGDFTAFARDFPNFRPAYFLAYPGFDPSCVCDPLAYRGGVLHHTLPQDSTTHFIANLMAHAEQLALKLADHAEAHESGFQQAELRLHLRCAEDGNAGALFPLGTGASSTFRFSLPETTVKATLEWQSTEALISLLSLRWRKKSSGTWEECLGNNLQDRILIHRNAIQAYHSHFYSFFKGHDPAHLQIQDLPPEPLELELDFRTETHPSRLATRLLQDQNFNYLLRLGAQVRELRDSRREDAARLAKLRDRVKELKAKEERYNSPLRVFGRFLFLLKKSLSRYR